MSGIVGLAEWNAPVVNAPLLGELTRFLTYRGPDSCKIWAETNIGLGFTLLRTDFARPATDQPFTLDGKQWIVADARIDARDELCRALLTRGCAVGKGAPACELILQAYRAWGKDCVQYLRGDFAFAIWDAGIRSFFCARDHFGVKPFYYASTANFLVFSNTLNCVRFHPQVSTARNDAAIGDFLLFGLNYDLATTAYRDVRRLPPAYWMQIDRDGVQIQKYWSPPIDGRIRYRDPQEYIQHFQDLLAKAVADRLPSDRAGILLSGGLDSSSLAAVAREHSMMANGKPELFAYTVVYERLIPDQDGRYAREVADYLQVPLEQIAVDDLPLFGGWDNERLAPPEPMEDPFFAGVFDQFRMISKDCRVAFDGEGPDNLMYFEIAPYLRDLISRGKWKDFAAVASGYVGHLRFPWKGFVRKIRTIGGAESSGLEFPKWIAPDFARRMNLRQRWHDCLHPAFERHPILPSSHGSLTLPHWVHMFENENPGITREPVEVRRPFIDLRIVEFLLALPPFPWFLEKKLLRDAMKRKLPDSVRMRRKSPLPGDPVSARIKQDGFKIHDEANWNGAIEAYVERNAAEEWGNARNSGKIRLVLRPLALNLWLQSAQRVGYNVNSGMGND